jgi:WhiB family transcriptional regulator, redox-sensing transcriptional regulator
VTSDLLGWRADAACADTPIDWWFPPSEAPGRPKDDGTSALVPDETRELCDTCPVRQECLDHALRHERHGIWAGTSARGRARLRRALKIRLQELDHDELTATITHLTDHGTPQPLQSSSA